jgi:hypothetical protein
MNHFSRYSSNLLENFEIFLLIESLHGRKFKVIRNESRENSKQELKTRSGETTEKETSNAGAVVE